MSEQPAKGNEDKPAGYEPPQYVPPAEFSAPGQGSAVPPPPSYESTTQADATQPLPPYGQSAYTQNAQGQSDFYTQPTPPSSTPPASSYTPGDYSQQPPSPYNQPPSPYQQQPYGQPNPYGQPAYYAMPSQPKGLSIASMICGIATLVGFGFFILPQIAAVILGHLALNREPAGKGMAIAGLVMGYIGVALAIIWIIFIVALGASSRYNY
ncbi:DUF4190 domain-containing protein [Paenarthrobacter sp. NPDC018779]|uniref:DUF4190 domain-containing protein n=1 Tax=Paenarthrobacter sp. NPDC018779 TaxID=3364375 RepID=UPI0037C54FEF